MEASSFLVYQGACKSIFASLQVACEYSLKYLSLLLLWSMHILK